MFAKLRENTRFVHECPKPRNLYPEPNLIQIWVLEAECVKLVRSEIGPVAAFKTVLEVPRLPKTRSGKILRGTMQKIADGEAWNMPATIDDPVILDEITDALTRRGIKKDA